MGRAHEVRKVAMAKTAAAKAKLYSRYGKEIYLAAKAGGTDPDGNLALRRIIAKAKKEQVPADVIKRAVDKVKSGATEDYQEKTFEGYGPSGSTVIVKCLTDNINRTISQVRPAFTKSKAKLGNEGSVSYLYDTYSILTFKGLDEEQTLEALMEGEADCQEIETHEDGSIELTGALTDLYKMKDAIEAACPDAEFDVEEIATTPQEYVSLEGEDMELFEHYKPDVVLYEEGLDSHTLNKAVHYIQQADMLIIGGTSLAVYPAASLLHYAPEGIPVFVIDPKIPQQAHRMGYHLIEKGASEGVQELKNILLSETR